MRTGSHVNAYFKGNHVGETSMSRHAGIERGFGIFDDRDSAPAFYFSQARYPVIKHPG